MAHATWYFDFVSPYAYLGLHGLDRLPAGTRVEMVPVLFAGLLRHWGHKGPAEIAPKRLWTYRSCLWLAQRSGIAFVLPAAHPFNSLPYLRLALAAGATAPVVRAIFEALWTTGVNPATPSVLAELCRSLRVEPEQCDSEQVKRLLRESTDRAAGEGVFGVPSLVVGQEVFWGSDAVDFAAAYVRDPAILSTAPMQRAQSIPVGASRASHL